MKKRWFLVFVSLALCLCLMPNQAHRTIAQDTTLPDGVTEIDLQTILGDDAIDIKEAWMPNADICILLRSKPEEEDEKYGATFYELITLDMKALSPISRTPIPNAAYHYRSGWDDGILQFWFMASEGSSYNSLFWIKDAVRSTRCVSIAPDGTMDISDTPQRGRVVMPDGTTAIETANDGSLYAIDLKSSEKELLIQGIPRALWQPDTPEALASDTAFEAYAQYVPCPDEAEHWLDESSLDFYHTREFYATYVLDAYRFVYVVSSWEWSAGYGVYDLRTRTDHRITGHGDFFGIVNNTLFGETLRADATTYEITPLPELVHEQFEAAARWDTNALVDCDISPDGKLLALTGMIARSHSEKKWWTEKNIEPKFDYAHTVTLTDIETGALVATYDIDNPLATESIVSFYDDTHIMLFCEPTQQGGSSYIYLLDISDCLQ